MLTIKIKTDNAAFQPDPTLEITRLLTRITRFFNNSEEFVDVNVPLYDGNGNNVGHVTYTKD